MHSVNLKTGDVWFRFSSPLKLMNQHFISSYPQTLKVIKIHALQKKKKKMKTQLSFQLKPSDFTDYFDLSLKS